MLKHKLKFLKKSKLFNMTVYKLYLRMQSFRMREIIIKKHWGVNKDKIVYIIRRESSDAGFFSNFFYVLGHLVYASKQGWYPVIDMKNYKTLYNENIPINSTMNAWEYYFQQPTQIGLREAYKSKNIILSSDEYFTQYVPLYTGNAPVILENKDVDFLHTYVDKYISINQDILDEVNKFFSQINTNLHILGVHYRGTDMKVYPDHPRPITSSECIKRIQNQLDNGNADIVIICSDESEMIEKCKNAFGEKAFFTNSYRASKGSRYGIHNENKKIRQNHKYRMGYEVMIDMLILARCDSLMCGYSNVAYAAILMNNNQYKNIFYNFSHH